MSVPLFLKFPKDYFRYNWNTRLSLAGKAVLITVYAELGKAGGNVIKGPILYISKVYGLKVYTYSKGIQELKRFNIIKVVYEEGFKNRDKTRIGIQGLYDMEEYNKEIEELKKKYGRELVNEIQDLSGIIYCAYDTNIIADILGQAGIYGMDPVRKAFSYMKKMRVDNPKRTYKYFRNILKRHN